MGAGVVRVFPRIGFRPVSEMDRADVLAVLTPTWHSEAGHRWRLRQRISAVLAWSIAMEHRTRQRLRRSGVAAHRIRERVGDC